MTGAAMNELVRVGNDKLVGLITQLSHHTPKSLFFNPITNRH
jgi:vacuolar-type H+-ATPase catalytic subunit A/Vma1